MNAAENLNERRISIVLMAAIYVMPAVFWWFLLRRGFARSTRMAAFTYAAITFGFGLLAVRDSLG